MPRQRVGQRSDQIYLLTVCLSVCRSVSRPSLAYHQRMHPSIHACIPTIRACFCSPESSPCLASPRVASSQTQRHAMPCHTSTMRSQKCQVRASTLWVWVHVCMYAFHSFILLGRRHLSMPFRFTKIARKEKESTWIPGVLPSFSLASLLPSWLHHRRCTNGC